MDPLSITRLPGITHLEGENLPPKLTSHVESSRYRILGYYQVDNLARWRAWKSLKDRSITLDRWLFYACPLTMIEAVINAGQPLPYGEFYPHVFSAEAVYLYAKADAAARVAMKFGEETEGFLMSCRTLPGNIQRNQTPHPAATQPPKGYDSILVTRGVDLGSGELESDLYALFDGGRALLRYITHITRS